MPSDPRPVVLNVDDNEICRQAASRILEFHGFRVREASCGAEALCMARAEFPDVVLLDVGLPDMSGLEVCRILKSDPATSRIPVFHIAASSVKAGTGSYRAEPVEPVEPEALVATITRCCARARPKNRRGGRPTSGRPLSIPSAMVSRWWTPKGASYA